MYSEVGKIVRVFCMHEVGKAFIVGKAIVGRYNHTYIKKTG